MQNKLHIVAILEVISFCVLAIFLLFFCAPFFAHAEDGNGESVEMVEAVQEASAENENAVGENTVKETITNDFLVTPVVTNEKAKARDIIKKELLVTNNTKERIDLYISVENIDPNEGTQVFTGPGKSDLSKSLANWVEITRGVIELSAGESRKIPYLIHVNLSAKPGSYYARIQFQKGSKRSEAEASKEGSALMLNVEVVDDANERLQLGNFKSEDGVVFGNSVSFSYLLENIGNRGIEPRGSIRIFNRRGEEVGSVPLNAEGEEITPDNKSQLATVWGATGRFGKYKAFLDLEYGENQLASVQDTIYFWVFPWKEIMIALGGVVMLAIVGTYIVHMRAMVQPARARRSFEEASYGEEQPQRQQPFSSRVSRTSTPMVTHVSSQPYRKAPTHVTVLNTVAKKPIPVYNQRESAPACYGDTVELVARGSHQSTKTHGNVVQLSSRR
jgi:hypothetical protein